MLPIPQSLPLNYVGQRELLGVIQSGDLDQVLVVHTEKDGMESIIEDQRIGLLKCDRRGTSWDQTGGYCPTPEVVEIVEFLGTE